MTICINDIRDKFKIVDGKLVSNNENNIHIYPKEDGKIYIKAKFGNKWKTLQYSHVMFALQDNCDYFGKHITYKDGNPKNCELGNMVIQNVRGL